MEITYSPDIDAMNITLSENEVVETVEFKTNVYFDLDADGNIVNIEILTASHFVTNPNDIRFITLAAAQREK